MSSLAQSSDRQQAGGEARPLERRELEPAPAVAGRTLALYGVPLAAGTAAVRAYRALALVVPAVLGAARSSCSGARSLASSWRSPAAGRTSR